MDVVETFPITRWVYVKESEHGGGGDIDKIREETREKGKEENKFFMAFLKRRQPPLLVNE